MPDVPPTTPQILTDALVRAQALAHSATTDATELAATTPTPHPDLTPRAAALATAARNLAHSLTASAAEPHPQASLPHTNSTTAP